MNKLFKENFYAISVRVKAKDEGIVSYRARTLKGIVVDKNRRDAEERAINIILGAFSQTDGPKITKSELKVLSCELFNDFIATPKIP